MAFRFVKATRAEDVTGFPAELREMLWRANFSYQPEYVVLARGIGPGLVDFKASVYIPQRSVYGAAPHFFQARATSAEMAIQAVAYVAMCSLRSELPILSEMPFHYHPILQHGIVNHVEYAQENSPLFEQRVSGLVRSMDHYIRCVTRELWVTRARLNRLQRAIEPSVRMCFVPHSVLYGEDIRSIPYDEVGPDYRFPPVNFIQAPPTETRARMSVGLRVPIIPQTEATPPSLLGPAVPLTHPLAPEDTGSPGHHLLVDFPEDFARYPYRSV